MRGDHSATRARAVDTAEREVPPGWKRCTNKACRRIKPLRLFWRNKNNRDGRQNYCTTCMKAANLARRETPEYRDWAADYGARPGTKALHRAYAGSEAGARSQAAYRTSPKGRMTAARKLARLRLRRSTDPARRTTLRALIRLYNGCLAALDPADDKPVPAGAKRCPGCRAPKPLRGWFYADRARPDGFSELCRACAPQTRAERVAANHRHYFETKRARIVGCLRGARKRLANAKTESNRTRIARSIAGYEAELARDAGKPAGDRKGA